MEPARPAQPASLNLLSTANQLILLVFFFSSYFQSNEARSKYRNKGQRQQAHHDPNSVGGITISLKEVSNNTTIKAGANTSGAPGTEAGAVNAAKIVATAASLTLRPTTEGFPATRFNSAFKHNAPIKLAAPMTSQATG